MRDGVSIHPQDEDESLPAGHGHGDDLRHSPGDERVQVVGQRVMLGLRNADDAVFPRRVLVLDTDEDHAAVGVAERGDRLRDVALVPLLLGLERR